MEHMSLAEPDLPPRPEGKTLAGLHEELASNAWYWRPLASLASLLIAVGFLVFGGAFLVDDNSRANEQIVPVTIAALVMVNTGYILSVALWFLQRNWVYQLECIFLPCLVSSFLGFVNTLVVPKLVLGNSSMTAPALASLLVSIVSTIIYGILSTLTWRRIGKLRRQRGAPEQNSLAYVSDEELQRRQMNGLLMRKDQITAAQFASQRTYHIDMPIPKSKRDHDYDGSGTVTGPPSYVQYY